MKKNKTETFIEKAKKNYVDKYDYSGILYINSTTEVDILCVEHNQTFKQTPSNHLRGWNGCPKCQAPRIDSTEAFINKSKEIHGAKYDYSKSEYYNASTKILIMCSEHGEFEQLASHHTNGHGCPKCAINSRVLKKTYDTETFIAKAKEVHDDKYDYTKVEYISSKSKVKIICSEHGEFEQSPAKHLNNQGCYKCGKESVSKKLKVSTYDLITKLKIKHNNKYNYNLSDYMNSHSKIDIECPIHGSFKQVVYDHNNGHGCPKCTSSVSSYEIELNDFIRSLNYDTVTSSRSIISPHQLDLYIPSKNIAIEFDGIYWHSELYKSDDYHINKTNLCEAKNIRLIHIFEDEWKYKKDVVKSRLKNILGVTDNKIYARNCELSIMANTERDVFLNENHLQGSVKSSINICLTHKGEIVSSMHFNKPRLGVGSSGEHYELSRFCNKIDTSVVGGASKLLKFFYNTYGQIKLISYADRRWSEGSIYDTLGFTQTRINKPNYWYVVNNKRAHRFNFRKSMLRKEGFDTTNSTEREIMLSRGIYRIYDCGTITYEKSPE
jgi:hypothetical protein